MPSWAHSKKRWPWPSPPPVAPPIVQPEPASGALDVTEQAEAEGGKVQQSDAKKAERRKKRRKGSQQLSAPDEKKPTNTQAPGTVNTGQGGGTGGQGGGNTGTNVNTGGNK